MAEIVVGASLNRHSVECHASSIQKECLVKQAVLTGSGLWTPDEGITNAELVASLSQAVEAWNSENAEAIESG